MDAALPLPAALGRAGRVDVPAARAAVGSTVARVARRASYWAPVFVALGLFAQVAFLGLRPALREAERLEGAQTVLEARRERALETSRALALELRARRDPIYRERQRRMRVHPASADGG